MPKRENIPDDAEYHIIIGGKIVAKHCRHCNRFTKGSKAHYTKEHKGTKNRCTYKPPSTDSAPAPAPSTGSANLATFPEGLDPNAVPVVSTLPGSGSSGVSWADMAPVPAGYAPVQFSQANYDLEPGPSLNLSRMEEDQDEWSFLGMLGLNM